MTILCEVDFLLDKNTHITLTPGSTLELYFKGLFKVSQGSSLNMPPDNPSSVMIYNLGTSQMEINQSSAVCAMIFSPDAVLHLAQGDQFLWQVHWPKHQAGYEFGIPLGYQPLARRVQQHH